MRHPLFYLCRGVQHILDKDAVAGSWIVDKDVGHRTNDAPVLQNRTAAHECVKYRTKFFSYFYSA